MHLEVWAIFRLQQYIGATCWYSLRSCRKEDFLLLLKILFSKMIVTAKIFSRAEIFSKSSEVVGHKSFFQGLRQCSLKKGLPPAPVDFRSHSPDTIKPRHWLKYHKYSYNSWLLCGPSQGYQQLRNQKQLFLGDAQNLAPFCAR